MTKKRKNSRAKGKNGELELCQFLKKYGINARRGQQFSGSPDSPDIVHDLGPFHVECKRVETFNAYSALEQAEVDRGDDENPIVFHRRSRKDWIVVMYAEDFITLIQDLEKETDGD